MDSKANLIIHILDMIIVKIITPVYISNLCTDVNILCPLKCGIVNEYSKLRILVT